MAVNVNETEIKYDAPADGGVPNLDGLPQVADMATPDEIELEAEYYDTADLRLLRAGITLRRRRGGDDAGWHLKLPLGGDTRREVRLPPGRVGDAVPGELADLVRVHARGEPLRPVARLTTRRRLLILVDECRCTGRKAVRRARYASEAMAPAVGKKARRFARRMKKVQSVLGEHQDAVIARQAERELGMSAHLAGENAFSYGLLYGGDACHAERLQAQARRTWKRASRSRYRRWMR
jgi:CHAD domain-containing protein/CYTH domain-containing protein